eukprot:7989876-Alexandrium_andersonii.AAC.1
MWPGPAAQVGTVCGTAAPCRAVRRAAIHARAPAATVCQPDLARSRGRLRCCAMDRAARILVDE